MEYEDDMDEDLGVVDNEEQEDLGEMYLERSRSAFYSAKNYFDANIRRNMENSVRQFNSQHHHGSKYLSDSFRFKSKLFKPKSRIAARNHEAALAQAVFSTLDICNISAVDQDNPLQVHSAQFHNELINYQLQNQIPWFQTCLGAYQDTMVYGVVVSKHYWDFRKSCNAVDIVAPENFMFDPSCNWIDPIETSPYLIEMIPMYVYEVRRRIREDGWNKVSDKALLSARQHSVDSIRVTREGDRLDPKDRPNNIRANDIVWVHLNIMAKDDGSGDVAFYTLGTEAILTDPVDIGEMFLNGERPYVMGKCVVETHRNYSSGLMDMTRGLQIEANDITNQRLDNVKIAMDKRYFIARGQQVDITSLRLNTPGGVTFLNNPEKDVKVVSTPDVTSSSYQEISLLNNDMDGLVGGFNASSVQSNRQLNETVGGMNLLSSQANQITEYQIRTFVETWMKKAIGKMLTLNKAHMTDRKMIALAGKRAGLMKEYNNSVDELAHYLMDQDLLMNIAVGMGATNPATRCERLMLVVNNLTRVSPDAQSRLNFNEIAKEMFGSVGYDNGARFINGGYDEEDPRIAQMQQQIQALQQQLQAKKPQELVEAEVAKKKAETVKIYTEAAFGAMQAGEVAAQMPAVTQVADVIMQSSGFTPQAGQDPNYPKVTVDKQTLEAAKKESDDHYFKRNNNPLTPLSPERGVNKGIEGGKE